MSLELDQASEPGLRTGHVISVVRPRTGAVARLGVIPTAPGESDDGRVGGRIERDSRRTHCSGNLEQHNVIQDMKFELRQRRYTGMHVGTVANMHRMVRGIRGGALRYASTGNVSVLRMGCGCYPVHLGVCSSAVVHIGDRRFEGAEDKAPHEQQRDGALDTPGPER